MHPRGASIGIKLERHSELSHTLVFPKEGYVTRNSSFVRYPTRFKNGLILLSATQNIAKLFASYVTSRLTLQISFGLPLGILRHN
jgi:hypothetical protein